MSKTMTINQFIAKKHKELAAFKESIRGDKYPHGRFVLQVWDPQWRNGVEKSSPPTTTSKTVCLTLCWEPIACKRGSKEDRKTTQVVIEHNGEYNGQARDISHEKYRSNKCEGGYRYVNDTGIVVHPYMNHKWGYIRLFDSQDKIVAHATKLGFPAIMITTFNDAIALQKEPGDVMKKWLKWAMLNSLTEKK